VTDLPLTRNGEQVARNLRGLLATFDFRLVLASPLQRARHTAELAGLRPEITPDLREWDYGGYEGLTTPQIRDQLGVPDWTVFRDGVVPGDTPGETVEEVAARASRVLARVLPVLADGDVALVGHGHSLRVLTTVFLQQEPRMGAQLLLDAGSLSVLRYEHAVPSIGLWNRVPDEL
jgi:probable phosphoglycerate mutase